MRLLDEISGLLARIDSGENFTFVRYGDGEVMLMSGTQVGPGTQAGTVDKWTSPGHQTLLGRDMRVMLSHPEWIYGIPCSCCNDPLKHRIMCMIPDIPATQVTFANMFVNAAYPVFEQWVSTIKRSVVLITNEDGKGRPYPFEHKAHMLLPDDCVNVWEDDVHRTSLITEAQQLAQANDNTLFLFSGGPLKVLIHYMYEANPNNAYIDVGSAIDKWAHGGFTRPYHNRNNNSPYTNRNCVF